MKEATGELNMTVIAVVAIAAVGAFFYAFVWPRIKGTVNSQSVCSNGANYSYGNTKDADYVSCGSADAKGQYTCKYNEDAGKGDGSIKTRTVTCKQK